MKWAKYHKETKCRKHPRGFLRIYRIIALGGKGRYDYDPEPLSVRFIHR